MTRRIETSETAATEETAYDVLDLLIRLNGARPVLDVLRYWYIVTALEGKRKTAARPNRQSA